MLWIPQSIIINLNFFFVFFVSTKFPIRFNYIILNWLDKTLVAYVFISSLWVAKLLLFEFLFVAVSLSLALGLHVAL